MAGRVLAGRVYRRLYDDPAMPSAYLDLARAFAGLTDPRIDRTKTHGLTDIVVIALCAVVCGADSWLEEEEEFGHAKRDWLARLAPGAAGA